MHNRERQLHFRQYVMKFELYIISLWLLFVLMIVVKINFPICFDADCHYIGTKTLISTNILPLTSLIFIVTIAICYFRLKYRLQSNVGLPVIAKKVEDLSYEHLTFLTTYIVPLICFNLDNTRYIIALFILLIVIGQIYIKTDKFYANPTLAILGFRLYKFEIDGVSKVLITTQRISESDKIVFTTIDEKFVSGRKA
ncbi:anti-phage protein KwaA [Pseudomonas corrugata]|uniref:anti-phage protein KwaA n=1 Tax=Pseudomonas corrugata TaxID=47879 RepID=UPI003CC6064D